ncbi:MAG: hypothetical protein AB2L22_13070 [Syntrophales bacterium]
MLKYQIHKLSKGGKEGRSVLLEDILTSDVFGTMFYFPYEYLLKPFLQYVIIKNPNSNFSVPAEEPVRIGFWDGIPWPKPPFPKVKRQSIEPDVVLEWDNLLLFIEAKFYSSTDPEELLREYLVGANHASSNKRFFLLLIDKNISPPNVFSKEDAAMVSIPHYIEKRVKQLDLPDELAIDISKNVLWANWQTFYLVAEDYLEKAMNGENPDLSLIRNRFMYDLLSVLDRKGIVPYRKLDMKFFESLLVNAQFLDQIGVRIKRQFTDLSMLSVVPSVLDKMINLQRVNDPVPFLYSINLATDLLDFK